MSDRHEQRGGGYLRGGAGWLGMGPITSDIQVTDEMIDRVPQFVQEWYQRIKTTGRRSNGA